MNIKPQLNIIVGLPGSGKTTLANYVLTECPFNFKLFDDVSTSKTLADVCTALFMGEDCIVVDPALCNENAQRRAKELFEPLANVIWVFFENSIEKAFTNLQRRVYNGDTRRVSKSYLSFLSQNYYIPDGANVREIYSGG